MSKKLQGRNKQRSKFDIWKYLYSLQIYGAIPSPLFKSFEKLEYAEDFCAGKIRFQALENYKLIEDSERVDLTEGRGEKSIKGEMVVVNAIDKTLNIVNGLETLSVNSNNDSHFIYCLSMPLNGRYTNEIEKFGKYIVRIDCPSLLIRDIAIAMCNDNKLKLNPPILEADKVRYDKYSFSESRPNISKINRMRWCQKPSSYSEEREYRLHFNASNPKLLSKDGIYLIHLESEIKYCEIIKV